MVSPHRLAELASALADSSRATIISALFDGSSRPAGELAALCDVSAATVSGHLSKLLRLGLVAVEARGRHRYFRLGGPDVAAAIEALGRVLPRVEVHHSAAQREVRELRLCYDHLAGRTAVQLCDALVGKGWLGEGLTPTPRGRRELDALTRSADLQAKPCLDWTERRDHLGGALGASLATRLLSEAWVVRVKGSRALRLTAKGDRGLAALGVPTFAATPPSE